MSVVTMAARVSSSSAAIRVDLHPVQAAFCDSDALYRGFVGGRGTGKSWIGAYDLIKRARPGRLYGMYAPTYPMLRDASQRAFLDIGERLHVIRRIYKSDGIITLGNGAEIMCRSLDDPERARGPNTSGAWIDEASLTGPKAYEIVIACLREQGEQGWLSATFTPKGMNHWTYDVFGRERARTELFRAKTRDNPFLPSGFADTLATQYSGAFARQELEGEFVAFEGLVYDEFRRDAHVMHREAAEFQRVIVGCDEGYTNPAVALAIGIDGDGRAHVLDEFYQSRVLQASFVDECCRIRDRYQSDGFWVDPSAAGLIAEMRKAGLRVHEANNAVNDGIQAVKARLAVQGDGRPRLTIEPTCVNTIAEFESYVWARDKAGQATDKPAKENDHCLVAGTLVLTERGHIPIEQVTTSDKVLTRQGWRRVVASGMTGKAAEVMTAYFSNGARLTGTPDHRVWVNGKGHIALRALRYGDTMELPEYYGGSPCLIKQMSLSIEGSHSEGTRIRPNGQTAITTYPMQLSGCEASGGCTRKYGETFMDQFRTASWCITETGIRLTTTRLTWSAFQTRSTTITMPLICQSGNASGFETILCELGNWLPIGMDHQRGASGTRFWGSCRGKAVNRTPTLANSVAKNVRLSPVMGMNDFAPMPASQRGDGPAGLTTKNGFASNAGKYSSATNTPNDGTAPVYVLGISGILADRVPVYDLTIDTVSEFFANGVLVHNSMDALRYAVMGLGVHARPIFRAV